MAQKYKGHIIRLTDETFERLKKFAQPFEAPDTAINRVLDLAEKADNTGLEPCDCSVCREHR